MMYEFKFPDVGEGVHEGKILKLNCNIGDVVSEGEILAIVETDKVVAEIPSPKKGKIKQFGASEGQVIEVGQTLVHLELDDNSIIESEKSITVSEESAGVVGELEGAGKFVLAASGEGRIDKGPEHGLLHSSSKVLATPMARHLATQFKVDLKQVKGSGPAGRIMKGDILSTFEKQNVAPGLSIAPARQSSSGTEMTMIRKTIMQNMEASHQIPAAVLNEMLVIDELWKWRQKINEKRTQHLSFQSVFIKVLGHALKKFPDFAATFDRENQTLNRSEEINVGFALDLERGLLVPVIKNIPNLNIEEIDIQMKKLISSARENKLAVSDLRGGVFSISNYGSFGGIFGRPLINPPQVAILGMGRIHESVVVENHQMVIRTVLPLSLVFDHRVIDGAYAGKFITFMGELLKDPYQIILELK